MSQQGTRLPDWLESLFYSDDFMGTGEHGVIIWPDVRKPYLLELWEDTSGNKWCHFLGLYDGKPKTPPLPLPVTHDSPVICGYSEG